MSSKKRATPIKESLGYFAKSSLQEDGTVQPLSEQLTRYENWNFPSGELFVVASSAKDLGLPKVSDAPLVMTHKTIEKIKAKHELSLEEVKVLDELLELSPLAMDSLKRSDALVVVADSLDRDNNHILIALHIEKEKGKFVVDEVTSMYGKEEFNWMLENVATAQNTQFYVNERTGDWLARHKPSLALPVYNLLQEQCNKYDRQLQETYPGLKGYTKTKVPADWAKDVTRHIYQSHDDITYILDVGYVNNGCDGYGIDAYYMGKISSSAGTLSDTHYARYKNKVFEDGQKQILQTIDERYKASQNLAEPKRAPSLEEVREETAKSSATLTRNHKKECGREIF